MYSHFRRSQETFTFACENVDNFSPAARQNFIQEIFCNRINELAPCYDNALAESVNGTLKVELVHRTFYPTRQKAYEEIARWIELRYNRTRLHSGLGYRTPQEVMDEYLNGQEAA